MPAGAGRLTWHLIPHTHWDREWYLPRAGFQARLGPVLREVLDQLEADPSARFVLDGQTVLVEDYLALRPDEAARVSAAAARGALELGPWYVLADELIPSGESLLRNLVEGTRDATALGRRMDVLYSPDAFGHPALLPTLAGEFGIRFGVAWRGVGRPSGADTDLYRWAGPDGHGILLHHLPGEGYSSGARVPARWTAVRARLAGRAGTRHIPVFLGADHHAVPPSLAAVRDAIQALEPEARVRLSSLTEYFEAVERSTATLVPMTGELRRGDGHTWVLQGVHGTRARMKRRYAAAELRLQRLAEPAAALAALGGGADRRGLLRTAWRTLIQSQFHDTLGGCSADTVAREQAVRLQSVEAMSREIVVGALHELAGHDPDLARESPADGEPRLVLWNPCARKRAGIITAEVTCFRRDIPVGPPAGDPVRTGPGWQPFTLRASDGRLLAVQILAVRKDRERLDAPRHYPDQDEVDRVYLALPAPPVDGLALEHLSLVPGSGLAPEGAVAARPGSLRNGRVAVRLSRAGWTLEDRGTGRQWRALGTLVDEPDRGDTYTFSPGVGPVVRSLTGERSTVLARGPLVGALETRGRVITPRGWVDVRRVVAIHDDSPAVRIRLDLWNGASDHRLRIRFPTGGRGAALAGAGFGAETREPVANPARTAIEHQVRTAPAHRYVAAGGLAVLAPGFFEYEWTSRGELLVTVLRGVGQLSRDDLRERPGHAGWPMPVPEAQEHGAHRVELAVAPLADAASVPALERMWEDLFLPVGGVFCRQFASGGSPADPGGVTLEGDGLVFSAALPAGDGRGLVLRCWNALHRATSGRWIFTRPGIHAARLRADETPLAPLAVEADGLAVRFEAGPRQLVTVVVRR